MPADDKSERERRLAAALRANLQRRKQQARQRTGEERDEPAKANDTAPNARKTGPAGGKT